MHVDIPEMRLPSPGRVMTKRASGAKLLFYDVSGEGAKIQVMADLGCALCPPMARMFYREPRFFYQFPRNSLLWRLEVLSLGHITYHIRAQDISERAQRWDMEGMWTSLSLSSAGKMFGHSNTTRVQRRSIQ